MNLDTFKKINKAILELEKNEIKFDIAIRGDSEWLKGSTSAFFEPIHFEVATLANLSKIQKIIDRPILLNDKNNVVNIKGLKASTCITDVRTVMENIKTGKTNKSEFPSLKFYSELPTKNLGAPFNIKLITEVPTEQLEGDITYRYIGDADQCLYCIPNDDPLYMYLDKGFFMLQLNRTTKKCKTLIANELTVDVLLVMILTWITPAFAKQLPNECFINANMARVMRVKFEKDLVEHKDAYTRLKDLIMKDYEKNNNANMFEKVAEGSLAAATYNNIKLTKNTATYENISIESTDLLKELRRILIFDDRTDIYTLIRAFITDKINALEAHVFADDKKETVENSFKINNIPITIKRTTENTRRYINDVPINIIELEPVCFRASCFENQETFEKFIEAVRQMSLKYHDALANGLGVKIFDNLSGLDYKNPEAPLAAPRIKFKKIDDEYNLIIDENNHARIKFGDIIKGVAMLNRRTNDGYSYTGGYNRRNAEWARKELVSLLKECCTFDVKTSKKNEDGKVIRDEAGKIVYDITKKCELTDEQAAYIQKMAQEFHKKALEKSKIFLQTAITATGAKLVDFKGVQGYMVEGKLHKYFVNKDSNQVQDYTTGRHICIVEPGHQVSVGGDATAARLYALKHDAVTVKQIGTLSFRS
jgi:hypothetical protein